MQSQLASVPAFGIDTVQILSTEACRFLVREGYHFVVRYLGKLDEAELGRILCSGLALMPVTYSRKAGWVPSAGMGAADGQLAVQRLQALQMPQGVTVWLDLEGCAGPATATAEWINAWSMAVTSAGYQAGLYVGAQPGNMDADDLWHLPHTTRYWRSCSRVPEPSRRGWCMQQLKPPNLKLGPLQVDIDVVESDYRGDLPTWAVSS